MPRPTALILAFDFGGTKNTCARFGVDESGGYRMDALERRASPPDADAVYDYATMLELGRSQLQGAVPQAVGVSFGGPMRASDGVIVLSHHVPGWENVPLRARLASEFGVRVVVDNDANVAGLGETRFGAGIGCESVLYITVSTGVGGGWILDGKIYRGRNELAGEIGHMLIEPNGPPCMCGRRGCLEQLASGLSIGRIARERLAAENANSTPITSTILREMTGNDLANVTGLCVNQAALQGDPLAQGVMDTAANAMGTAIGNAMVLMNPQRVILGGGVSKAGERYMETVRAAARATVIPELRAAVDIVPAGLGDDSPLWGALALVI